MNENEVEWFYFKTILETNSFVTGRNQNKLLLNLLTNLSASTIKLRDVKINSNLSVNVNRHSYFDLNCVNETLYHGQKINININHGFCTFEKFTPLRILTERTCETLHTCS